MKQGSGGLHSEKFLKDMPSRTLANALLQSRIYVAIFIYLSVEKEKLNPSMFSSNFVNKEKARITLSVQQSCSLAPLEIVALPFCCALKHTNKQSCTRSLLKCNQLVLPVNQNNAHLPHFANLKVLGAAALITPPSPKSPTTMEL